MDLASYWDLEGNLVSAVVAALSGKGIYATEMLAGDNAARERVEVLANVSGETSRTDIDPTYTEMTIGYTMTLSLDVLTPISEPAEHARRRGIIRSLMSYPRCCPLINAHLAAMEVVHLRVAESSNTVSGQAGDFDELSSELNFTLEVALHAGKRPLS